ncbi:MAG: hypothetical protein CBC01_02225 [Betaproteobacteria bacterium TMED41]|nr:MAG: hypothetical protein CBC01_02225 [Betaproteobacteria bacterium TMED41]|tara:strand:+ start:187 stop:633 length:447 start_codon:yes stop_codon:yes gene_type:complete
MKNKIPPPILALLCMYIIYALDEQFPNFSFIYQEIFALFIAIEAFVIIFFAVKEFKKFRTTISPLKIDEVNNFVTSGVFRFSRNPMYLGLTSLQVAVGFYFGNWLMIIVIPLFIFYITFYQIVPEEKVLLERFGVDFKTYCSNVGRWL